MSDSSDSQTAEDASDAFDAFERLPEELLLHILGLLEPRDLVHGAAGVSARWRQVARDERLWRRVDLLAQDQHFSCVARFAPRLHRLDLSAVATDRGVIAEQAEHMSRVDNVLEGDVRALERLDLICCYAEPAKAKLILQRYRDSLTALTIRLFDQYISHREMMPLLAAMPRLRSLEVDGKHHNRYRYNVSDGFQALRKLVLYNTLGAPRDVDVGVNLLNAKGHQLESLTIFVRPLYYPVYIPNAPDLALEAAVKACVNVRTLHIEGVDYLPCIEVMDQLDTLILEGECPPGRTRDIVAASRRLTAVRTLVLVHVPDMDGVILEAFLNRCTALEEVQLAMRGYLYTKAFHVLADREARRTLPPLRWGLVLPPVRVRPLTVGFESSDSALRSECAVPCRSGIVSGTLEDVLPAAAATGRTATRRVVKDYYRCPRGKCELYTYE